MTLRAIILPLVSLSMISAPVAAAQVDRSTAPASGESELVGRPIIPILVLIGAIVAGILIADNDDDEPASA